MSRKKIISSLIKTNVSYAEYDKLLSKAKNVIVASGQMEVATEDTARSFAEGTCPETALYCGWYSLRKHVGAFDFVDCAVSYHIASLEAIDLRNAKPLSRRTIKLHHTICGRCS